MLISPKKLEFWRLSIREPLIEDGRLSEKAVPQNRRKVSMAPDFDLSIAPCFGFFRCFLVRERERKSTKEQTVRRKN
jgi:hypothetical protein